MNVYKCGVEMKSMHQAAMAGVCFDAGSCFIDSTARKNSVTTSSVHSAPDGMLHVTHCNQPYTNSKQRAAHTPHHTLPHNTPHTPPHNTHAPYSPSRPAAQPRWPPVGVSTKAVWGLAAIASKGMAS